jgi:hypothetical protein
VSGLQSGREIVDDDIVQGITAAAVESTDMVTDLEPEVEVS